MTQRFRKLPVMVRKIYANKWILLLLLLFPLSMWDTFFHFIKGVEGGREVKNIFKGRNIYLDEKNRRRKKYNFEKIFGSTLQL